MALGFHRHCPSCLKRGSSPSNLNVGRGFWHKIVWLQRLYNLRKLTLPRDRKADLGKKYKRRVSSLWSHQADFIWENCKKLKWIIFQSKITSCIYQLGSEMTGEMSYALRIFGNSHLFSWPRLSMQDLKHTQPPPPPAPSSVERNKQKLGRGRGGNLREHGKDREGEERKK